LKKAVKGLIFDDFEARDSYKKDSYKKSDLHIVIKNVKEQPFLFQNLKTELINVKKTTRNSKKNHF